MCTPPTFFSALNLPIMEVLWKFARRIKTLFFQVGCEQYLLLLKISTKSFAKLSDLQRKSSLAEVRTLVKAMGLYSSLYRISMPLGNVSGG